MKTKQDKVKNYSCVKRPTGMYNIVPVRFSKCLDFCLIELNNCHIIGFSLCVHNCRFVNKIYVFYKNAISPMIM